MMTVPLQLQPFYGSLDFVQDKPGEPAPEKNIHPLTPIMANNHISSAYSIDYDPFHPPCSVFLHNLSRSFFGQPLGLVAPSTSYTTHFIIPIIVFFSQHMPIPSQLVLLQYRDYVI